MGRRKIEIKPIRDDRNRSVTFLKRKGGLFKKAHELSVLCSVDVAVIIFGNNKKLYEYSSSDIHEIIARFQYYGGAHEHKGPADFADKGGDDDDDEDGDIGNEADERNTPVPEHVIHSHMQHHPGFQHVRHGTPTASPPMTNGPMPQFTRGPSPVPPGMSRPSSRTSQHAGHLRRTSANFAASHAHPGQSTPPQPPYAYSSNPPFYNSQASSQVPARSAHQATYPPPSFPVTHAQQMPAQQGYVHTNRGGSMPPAYPPTTAAPGPSNLSQSTSQEHHLQPPPPPPPGQRSPRMQHQRPTPSPQPTQQEFASPPLPQPKPLPAHTKAHSIFTPIDDSRSMLATIWGTSSSSVKQSDTEPPMKSENKQARLQTTDAVTKEREKPDVHDKRLPDASGLPPPSPPPKGPAKLNSAPVAPQMQAPARAGTNQSDAKRPRLTVQIPSEQSEDEGGGEGSGAEEPSTTRAPQQSQHGVVLPPPSPSAGSLLSAGAQGPPNPFARPAPPVNPTSHANSRDANHIETPISALPSRFMSDTLLPSPSTLYPDWAFGRSGDSNMLPSPLNFQTPIVANGSGWREEDRKRQNEDAEAGNDSKRSKT